MTEASASGAWLPEFEGQRPPFEPGHELSTTHGAYSPRKVEPLAADLVATMLADPAMPAHAKAPAYRLEVWALARATAQVQLVEEWLAERAAASGDPLGDLREDRVRSAYLILQRADARAAACRSRLGLTPVSAARLGKNVAQGQVAQADVALRMGALHKAEQELIAQGWTPPAPEPLGDDGSGQSNDE